jgi:hypothetical protein
MCKYLIYNNHFQYRTGKFDAAEIMLLFKGICHLLNLFTPPECAKAAQMLTEEIEYKRGKGENLCKEENASKPIILACQNIQMRFLNKRKWNIDD